jgi:hypothetical protein
MVKYAKKANLLACLKPGTEITYAYIAVTITEIPVPRRVTIIDVRYARIIMFLRWESIKVKVFNVGFRGRSEKPEAVIADSVENDAENARTSGYKHISVKRITNV